MESHGNFQGILKETEHIPGELIIEQNINTSPEQRSTDENLHEQALNFVNSHRHVFEQYARGGITIAPSPKGLNTFAFNLEKNTIYIHPMFYQELGLSEERTVFATLHEIEHFLEKKQVLAEDNGVKRYEGYINRIKKSRAFGLTDNCVADIYVNKSVIAKTNQGMADIEHGMYTEVLFKDSDFTSVPKHIQFAQGLLRESRVPDETCIVDEDVRAKLSYIQNLKGKSGIKLMDVMTSPNTSVVDRWELQDRFIMPIVEELKQKDIDEEKEKRQERNQEKSKQKSEKEIQESENGEPQQNENDGGQENTTDDKSEGQETELNPKKGEKRTGKGTGNGDTDLDSIDFDPDEVWKEEYDKAQESMMPDAVSDEDIEKAIEEYKKSQKEKQKSEKEMQEALDQEYAETLGVTKEELQQYRNIIKNLEQVINPETGRSTIQELKEIIKRIISKRKNKKLNPKYPVEEGDYLTEPAELIASVKAGNLSPKVWETLDIKEKHDQKYGEVEITFVCDRSGSMDMDGGGKLQEQRKAIVLGMEALKELSDMCKKEKQSLIKPLEVKHEIFTFQANDEDAVAVKNMSTESTETERIKTASRLSSCPGDSTTDFVPLEVIESDLDLKTKKKIKEGELKKIIFVLTDGGSDNPDRVQSVLRKLRELGVLVYGIGITDSGKPVLTTYSPDAQVVKTATQLPVVIGDLLKEHLSQI